MSDAMREPVRDLPARARTRAVNVGNVQIGGGAPVVVQSMTSTDTRDAEATLAQVRALAETGCDIVRVTLPAKGAVTAFERICGESPVPIVADIHFDYRLAIAAAHAGAAKLRVNPGNIGSWEKLDAVVDAAGAAGIAIRIGVNAGSLPREIAEHEGWTLADKLTAAAGIFTDHVETRGFKDVVLSAKAHSVAVTLEVYRRLSRELPDIPLHLGVTEAGGVRQGTIKSAVALGALLSEGIGDTLRVSLTADPVEEVPVAWGILEAVGVRRRGPEIVSCPTCGRTQVDLVSITSEVERRLVDCNKPISVAVMGCAVNGPGEAAEADVGVACGKNSALLFKHGTPIRTIAADDIVDELMAEIERL